MTDQIEPRTAGPRELDLPPSAVAELVRTRYGWEPLAVTRLDSELSTVARVDVASGSLVAKATLFSPAELEGTRWRVAAMQRLAELGLPVGRPLPDRSGHLVGVAETAAGPVVLVLSEWLIAVPLEAAAPTPDLLRHVGLTAARVASGLADWPAPPVAIGHPWELVRTLATIEQAIGSVPDPRTRQLVAEAASRFRDSVSPRLDRLPRSVVHHDLHDSNLLVDPIQGRVTGVLDFGDMVVGPRVAELAVAAAYASRGADDPVAAFLLVAEGWGRTLPLTEDEVGALFDAGIARLAVNAAVWASRSDGARGDYARSRSAKSAAALAALLAPDRDDVHAELRARLA